MKDTLIDKMKRFFDERTNYHISLVNKYANRLVGKYPKYNELLLFAQSHDESKFNYPEYIPYVHLTWRYKCLRDKENYKIPNDIKVRDAINFHRNTNRHHPEYWAWGDEDEIVNAVLMPNISIAEMVCDWCAVSEEKGNTPKEWADANIGVKWNFSEEQKKLIYDFIDVVWEDK